MAESYKQRLFRVGRAAIHAGYGAALQSARDIGGTMKSAVARDTGTLADSIRLETDRGKGRVFIKAGGAATTRPVQKGGPDYDYAMAQEFGTSDMPANPFFWPSWRMGRKTARSRINRAMKKAIEAEMKK